MAYTVADRDNLKAAIAEGVTSVSVGGRTVSYRTIDEMVRILAMIERDLGLIPNGGITYQTVGHSKGFR